MAFVDDYTAWVAGPSAEANRAGIQAIICRALDWERRSGAQFEGEKTAVVHFTRNKERSSEMSFLVKGDSVKPKESAKILGVVMDSELRYKQHIARMAAKGLTAALALKRLKMLSPRTARQLFTATVAPVMDYASSVWMHACGEKALSWLNSPQKTGTLAITGAFRIGQAIDQHPHIARNASPRLKKNPDDCTVRISVAENRPCGQRGTSRPHGDNTRIRCPTLGTPPAADARSRAREGGRKSQQSFGNRDRN